MSEPENHNDDNGPVVVPGEGVWFDPFAAFAEWNSPADITAYGTLGDEARA